MPVVAVAHKVGRHECVCVLSAKLHVMLSDTQCQKPDAASAARTSAACRGTGGWGEVLELGRRAFLLHVLSCRRLLL
jgi:hypothetical protein